jgi:hypothetical protein
MVMHGAGREQRWDRHAVGAGGAVGQDDVLAGADRLFGAPAKPIKALLMPAADRRRK